MDIVEFAEKVVGIKLLDCQKEMLKTFASLPKDSHILMTRNGPIVVDSKGRRVNYAGSDEKNVKQRRYHVY